MPRLGLIEVGQGDFAQGMFRGVARDLIPDAGAYDILNGLLDSDGAVVRRGPSEELSTADFGSTGLRWIWSGFLGPGQRDVFANADDFGVLDGANAPVNLGGAGLTAPVRAVEVGGLLFIPTANAIYGGSRKSADVSAGTISTTAGSRTVTGVGTSWLANVDAGMLLRVAAAGRYFAVASVESDTSLTLRDPATSTAAGQAYALTRLGSTAVSPYRSSTLYAQAAGRLFSLESARAYFTENDDPHTLNAAEDFHELPAGSTMLGAEQLGSTLMVFASSGLWAISGLDFSLTDASGNVSHRVEQVSSDLLLWNPEGIATWQGSLLSPCVDGLWAVSPGGPPQRISDSITRQWTDHVRAGHRLGGAAVYRSHYFLPVLDSSNTVVDTLVCRLDRPSRSRVGVVHPFSRLRGSGANVAAFTVRSGGATSRQPELLGAGRQASGRVLKLTRYFDSPADVAVDHDGTAYEWEMTTRDLPVNNGLVRLVKVLYELDGAGAVDWGDFDWGEADWAGAASSPTLTAAVGTGATVLSDSDWGDFDWGETDWAGEGEFTPLTDVAPTSNGRQPYAFNLQRQARYLRVRLRASGDAVRLVLRQVSLFVSPRGGP